MSVCVWEGGTMFVWEVSDHFTYLENWLYSFDAPLLPIGDLISLAWADILL